MIQPPLLAGLLSLKCYHIRWKLKSPKLVKICFMSDNLVLEFKCKYWLGIQMAMRISPSQDAWKMSMRIPVEFGLISWKRNICEQSTMKRFLLFFDSNNGSDDVDAEDNDELMMTVTWGTATAAKARREPKVKPGSIARKDARNYWRKYCQERGKKLLLEIL